MAEITLDPRNEVFSSHRNFLGALLPIIKDFGSALIGFVMNESSIHTDPKIRVAIAAKILERSAKPGFPAEDVLIDPLILTVSANQKAGKVTLTTIEMIAWEFSVNINLSTNNFCHTISRVFLAQAASADASCVITNPEKLPSFIPVAGP